MLKAGLQDLIEDQNPEELFELLDLLGKVKIFHLNNSIRKLIY